MTYSSKRAGTEMREERKAVPSTHLKVDAPGQRASCHRNHYLYLSKELYFTHTNTHTPTDISAHEEDNISNGLRLHRHKNTHFRETNLSLVYMQSKSYTSKRAAGHTCCWRGAMVEPGTELLRAEAPISCYAAGFTRPMMQP